jgi:S-DNA-T family DNA segregation ATPase FtsK/SpoIIIE
LWLGGIGTVMLLPLITTYARRLWISDDMAGWSTQLGRCLGGILLIGIGLELLAPGAPVGLPAGRGGLLAQLFARQAMNVTSLVPNGWSRAADWALLVACIIGGFAFCYKSWKLERPLFILRRPSMPKIGLFRSATPPWEGGDTVEDSQPAKPRAQVSAEPKPPIRIQSPDLAPAKSASAVTQSAPRQEDLFAPSERPAILPSPELLAEIPPSHRRQDRQGSAGAQCPTPGIRARRFPCEGQCDRGAPRPGRHHV